MERKDLPDWLRAAIACVFLAIFTLFALIFLAWYAQKVGVI